jgi:fused signal recognition particle receptor
MFGFIKDKLKKAVDLFSKATTEEKPVEPQTKPPAEKPKAAKKPEPKPVKKEELKAKKEEKPKAPAKTAEKQKPIAETPVAEAVIEKPVVQAPQPVQAAVLEQPKEKPAPQPIPASHKPVREQPAQKPVLKEEKQEEKLGFFGRLKAAVTTKKISRPEYETLFTEFEMDLLENNVALEVVDKMKEDLWEGLSSERFNRFSPEKRVQEALKESINGLFMEPFDMLEEARKHDLYIVCAVGVNGSGKTTTLAKLAHYFKKHNLEPVLAAGDTFRAAAIQQLEEHANKIGVKIIKQQYGADAAAVAFDAIQYAKANKARVVLIDTAGRLHSNTNLMEELKKIVRVAKPHTTIFIGEATTGNDCVYQATQFQQAVDIDGIILSKVDVDERGGAALSISYVTKKPILFFGNGQTYDDLEPFKKSRVLEQLTVT